ncbi:MAG: hypothetical protein Q7T87_11920 [Polaromonas sp.]|nr:hypothetical protein [Polaromonas sp.]
MIQTIAVALVSGLIGALLSAYLSYVVRLKAKSREDADERQRVAKVHFLRLTDTMATYLYAENFVKIFATAPGFKEDPNAFSMKVCAAIAEAVNSMTEADVKKAQLGGKHLFKVLRDSFGDLDMAVGDLGRMDEIAIFSYHRHRSAIARLNAILYSFEGTLEIGDPKLLDAAGVYSLFFAYKTYAETAGLLRAAFAKGAELSDKYTFFCLTRSYKETQKWFQKIFEQSHWLEDAKKVAPQADPTAASLGAAADRLTQDAKESASAT